MYGVPRVVGAQRRGVAVGVQHVGPKLQIALHAGARGGLGQHDAHAHFFTCLHRASPQRRNAARQAKPPDRCNPSVFPPFTSLSRRERAPGGVVQQQQPGVASSTFPPLPVAMHRLYLLRNS